MCSVFPQCRYNVASSSSSRDASIRLYVCNKEPILAQPLWYLLVDVAVAVMSFDRGPLDSEFLNLPSVIFILFDFGNGPLQTGMLNTIIFEVTLSVICVVGPFAGRTLTTDRKVLAQLFKALVVRSDNYHLKHAHIM